MPLAGVQLTIRGALALCYVAGFRGERLTTAVAIMCAESRRYIEAWHDNLAGDGTVASTDRGLFQINNKAHPTLSDKEAYNPKNNAVYAAQISNNGANFSPWAAYDNNAHLKFIPYVLAIKVLGRWRDRIPHWEKYETV